MLFTTNNHENPVQLVNIGDKLHIHDGLTVNQYRVTIMKWFVTPDYFLADVSCAVTRAHYGQIKLTTGRYFIVC